MDYIKIYKFSEAPAPLKALSDNGGDEDWVAILPTKFAGDYIPWLEEGTSFGCCCVNEYDHPSIKGWKVRIGCHA